MPIDATDEHLPLRRECHTFTRYLTYKAPDSYVLRKYVECHAAVLRDVPLPISIDGAMLRFAAAGPYRTRIADAYARIFRPRGILRRKLILLLAILENSKGYYEEITCGGGGAHWRAWLRIALSVAAFLAALTAGILVFAPHELLARMASKRARA